MAVTTVVNSAVSKQDILSVLLRDIDEKIEIQLIKSPERWGKSLKGLPLFKIKEIEAYRIKSDKVKAIIKNKRSRQKIHGRKVYMHRSYEIRKFFLHQREIQSKFEFTGKKHECSIKP